MHSTHTHTHTQEGTVSRAHAHARPPASGRACTHKCAWSHARTQASNQPKPHTHKTTPWCAHICTDAPRACAVPCGWHMSARLRANVQVRQSRAKQTHTLQRTTTTRAVTQTNALAGQTPVVPFLPMPQPYFALLFTARIPAPTPKPPPRPPPRAPQLSARARARHRTLCMSCHCRSAHMRGT